MPRANRAGVVGQPVVDEGEIRNHRLAPTLGQVAELLHQCSKIPYERPKRQQLPIREQLPPSVEAIQRHPKPKSFLAWQRLLRQPEGNVRIQRLQPVLGHLRHRPLVVRGQAVFLALEPIHDHGRHHRTQPSGAAFQTDILHGRDGAAAGAGSPGARHGPPAQTPVVLAPLRPVAAVLRNVAPHTEDDAGSVRLGLHGQQHPLPVLLA